MEERNPTLALCSAGHKYEARPNLGVGFVVATRACSISTPGMGWGQFLSTSVPDKVEGPCYLQRLLFHICFLWALSISLVAQPQLLVGDWDQAEGRNHG